MARSSVRRTKNDLNFLVALCVGALFVAAAIVFLLNQFQYRALLDIVRKDYQGFFITFGNDNFKGRLYFGLVFLFAVLGVLSAVAAALSAMKVFKGNEMIFFGLCALFALVSIIMYIILLIDISGGIDYGMIHIDVRDNIFWSAAFWLGIVFQALALIGSVLGWAKARR